MKSIKLIFLLLGAVILISACGRTAIKNQNQADEASQNLFRDTLDVSQKFIALNLRTEAALMQAGSYPDKETWDEEISEVLGAWQDLAGEAELLEGAAADYSKKKSPKTGYFYAPNAFAASAQEISNIFDRAPAGQKIKTLAQHLGVDAKRAFQILQQAQAEVEANAWNEAGDTFQKLETTAVVIKDGAKVAGFIGGIAVSGGVAGLAAAGTATKAAVVIGGADLVLEVTEDASKIALGNNNKVVEIVTSARTVTEPLATILAINSIPENLGSGFDKFNAVMLALDQLRSSAQEGKVVGVALPAYQSPENKDNQKIKAAAIDEAEIDEWLNQFGLKRVDGEIQEILEKVQQTVQSAKQAQERVAAGSEELIDVLEKESVVTLKESSFANEYDEYTVSISKGDFRGSFFSPPGNSFMRAQARRWAVDVKQPDRPGLIKTCQWTFYLNGVQFREMLDNRSCDFTDTFIDQIGSLRAEVKIQFKQGRSVFDEAGNYQEYVHDIVEEFILSRDFTVI